MSVDDISTTTVTVTGLRKAAENLMEIGSGATRTKIARDSLRDAAWVVGDAVKASTYTTFRQITGFIRAGIGVRVATGVRDDALSSVIAEVPQGYGLSSFTRAIYGRGRQATARRAAPLNKDVAFWWRFLEFGTHPRRAKRTPKFLYRSRTSQTAHQSKAIDKWMGSPSRGGIAARPWVRPARAAKQEQAVETYEATMRQRTEDEVANLPK